MAGSYEPMPNFGFSLHPGRQDSELTKEDIINLADVEYDWGVGENSHVIFDVVDTEELSKSCTSGQICSAEENKPLVYIVCLDRSHWATLVIVNRDEQYFAYYLDPLGGEVDDKIKASFKEQKIHCPNITVNRTDCKTGIFAVKAIESIFEVKEGKPLVRFSDAINNAVNNMKLPEGDSNLSEICDAVTYQEVDSTQICEKLGELLKTTELLHQTVHSFLIRSRETIAATLTVGYRDEQVVAYYVANNNSDITYENMKTLLSGKGIIPIFNPQKIGLFNSNENKNNRPELILQCAKVVRGVFRNRDYITTAKVNLDHFVSGKVIKEALNRLKARNKIEYKMLRCKSEIDKYISHYGGNLTAGEKFTTVQANILILFLESIALEDKELSGILGERIKSIRSRFILDEDFTVIDILRSQNLVHRSPDNMKTIIKCEKIKTFVQPELSICVFFQRLQTYLEQVICRLRRKKPSSEITVHSFFNTAEVKKKIIDEAETEQQIREYISKSFKNIVNRNSYLSSDRQFIMFEITVNIIPLLEGLYSDKKEVKNRKIQIEKLRNIQMEKNEYVHNFHEYSSEMARKFELKRYIDETRPTFFKFVYGQRVFKELNKPSLLLSSDQLEENLKKSLEEVSKDFNHVAEEFRNLCGNFKPAEDLLFLRGSRETITWEQPNSKSEEYLKTFIYFYVYLKHFFENEDELQVRREKYPSLPQRYEPFTNNYKMLHVCEHFTLLKLMNSPDTSKYDLLKNQIQRELKKKFGILKDSFHKIFDKFVKAKINIYEDKFIQKIYSDITSIKGAADLQLREEIKNNCEKRSPDAVDEKKISSDKIVQQILKLFDSIGNQYVFNNVEEAFNDETFLSVLTLNNINISSEYWKWLLEINYLQPYIVELIVRDQLDDESGLIRRGFVSFDTLNAVAEKLLESKFCATHIKKLLEKLFKMLKLLESEFCATHIKKLLEKLFKMLTTQNQNLESHQSSPEDSFSFPDLRAKMEKELVISIFCKLICQKLNMLKDKTHATEIWDNLCKAIPMWENFSGSFIHSERHLLEFTLGCLKLA